MLLSAANAVFRHKLGAALGVASVVAGTVWWRERAREKERQAEYEQYGVHDPSYEPQGSRGGGFPFRLFLVVFVGTYVAAFMAERVMTAPADKSGSRAVGGGGDLSTGGSSEEITAPVRPSADEVVSVPEVASVPVVVSVPKVVSVAVPKVVSEAVPEVVVTGSSPSPATPQQPPKQQRGGRLAEAMRHVDLTAPPF